MSARVRRLLRLAVVCLVGAACVPQAQAARLALVVGIDRYDNIPELRNAGADAQAMAQALRDVGYEVFRVVQPRRGLRELKDDIREFAQRIRGGDEVVLYFSGHGVQIDGDNYLLPTDVRAQGEAQVRDDGLALSRVLGDLRANKPAFTLAIVDACRDNPFESFGRSIGGRGLTGVAGAVGQMVIYAAGEGQKALDRLGRDDPVRNGLFTRVFVQEMRRPGVKVQDVMLAVRQRVYELAQTQNHTQVPAVYDQVLGTFYFVQPSQRDARQRTDPLSSGQGDGAGGIGGPPPVSLAPPRPESLTVVRPSVGETWRDCEDGCPTLTVLPTGPMPVVRAGGSGWQLARPLAVGVFEVTFAEWDRCAAERACRSGVDDGGWGRGQQPVVNVSWDDAQAFVGWLSARTGHRYRLPTSMEWEYAARAGSALAFPWGADAGFEMANCLQCGVPGFSGRRPAPVGRLTPNGFGLYDVIGNVWEWTQDCHDDSAGASCSIRSVRGGSFRTAAADASLDRVRPSQANVRSEQTGFRVAREW